MHAEKLWQTAGLELEEDLQRMMNLEKTIEHAATMKKTPMKI